MPKNNRLPTNESLAFGENTDKIIFHLHLDQESDEIPDGLKNADDEDTCVMCGIRAVWYTVEFQEDSESGLEEDRIERWWCDECIPQQMVDKWKAWAWTPDEQLEEYTSPSNSDAHDENSGLLNHQNRVFAASHLDLQRNSDDVEGILRHLGIDRADAVCDDCDHQAEWYFGDIHDVYRAYDFDAARDNSLFCKDCIDPDIVEMWVRRPWTPDAELGK